MNLTFLELTIYALACFRLAELLSSDRGPWNFLSRFRSFLKREAKTNKPLRQSAIHDGVTCIKCDSIWFALFIAPYAYFHDSLWLWLSTTGDIFILVFALSGLAIMLNRMFPKR